MDRHYNRSGEITITLIVKGMFYMATLRDKIWLWGQIPGGHHSPDYYKLSLIPKENKMTPTEGLEFFGIDKLCRVKLGKEPGYSFFDDPWLGEPAKQICLSPVASQAPTTPP